MASSSTSSVQKSFKYDVFISFKGDLRLNFVDHLFAALQLKNKIYTYKDDMRMKKGKLIADDLAESIKDSKFHIIVFSKNYPSSRWCLFELVNIMKCQKESGYSALPVFYDVEPSEVGDQTGDFGKAFAKLYEKMTFERYHKVAFGEASREIKNEKEKERDFEEWKEKTFEEWKEVLKGAIGMAGSELKKTADGREATFIRRIVELVLLELHSTHFNTDEKLVGMDSRIKEVLSSLGTGCDDVRMIGIKGIGGGGKTTLARVVFDRISLQFEGKSFVENIREVSNASSFGLKLLQNQVLSDVLNDQGMSVSSVYDGKNMLKRMMGGRKVLLVLDDVDHIEQLEALAGELSWFKPGSRIVITTRDEQVLVAHKVKLICNVSLLSSNESLCLFSRYAFGKELPIQGYEELSGKVVSYASGLPLTIRVLGSFLCGKNVSEWIDAIERLKTIPLEETLKKLEVSYMCLKEDYKEIFLDIVCIMKGWPLHNVIEALESRGFHAKIGLRVLEQKSLITIGESVGTHAHMEELGGNIVVKKYVGMHDHIEEMGRDIIRRSNPERPNIHSRLWINKEIEDIFLNDSGSEAIRCIHLYTEKLDPEIVMKGLRKMTDIRFLKLSFQTNFLKYDNFCLYFQDYLNYLWKYDMINQYFPDSLNYLYWIRYPFRYLPVTFKANNLVVLRMPSSNIKQLWKGGDQKVFNNLRVLDLSFSKLRTLNLGLTPNLETLKLEECGELKELYMPIACPRLRFVHLSILRVNTFQLGLAPNLETLTLESHDIFVEPYVPVKLLKLRSFKVYNSRVTMLDLGLTPNLEILELHRCYDLVEVRMPDGCIKLKHVTLDNITNLRILDLSRTSNLESHECSSLVSLTLSDSNLRILKIGLTSNLICVALTNCTYLEELYMAGECPKLEHLSVSHSNLTTLDLLLTPNLNRLHLEECYSLVELHMPNEWLNLESLMFSGSNLRTLKIGMAPNLTRLELTNCFYLEEIHMVGECPKLAHLSICRSNLTTLDLLLTPNLKKLRLEECYDLVKLHAPIGWLKKLVFLSLHGCLWYRSFLFGINEYTSRRVNESHEVSPLAMLHFTLERCPSHPDKNLPEFEFTCFSKEDLPPLSTMLEKFICEGPCACIKLETFLNSIRSLQRKVNVHSKGIQQSHSLLHSS